MKNFLSGLFNFFSSQWWVKITTSEPNCVYYFGPFDNESEAIQAKPGYVEDLEQEGALQIQTSLQNSSEPKELTIEFDSALRPTEMVSVG
ncbi:MAG: DUF1816 domain-containing protein [Cyanobacteria bacterium J06621_11]